MRGTAAPPDRIARVLRCEECWCVSASGAGWFGFVDEEPEDGQGAVVATYCPPCAARVLEAKPRELEYV